MPVENPFGQLPQALVHLRERQGLKQATAARKAGIAKQTLSEYETGKTAPSLPTLGRLLHTYQTDVEGLGRVLAELGGSQESTGPSADEIEAAVLRALRHHGLLPREDEKKKREPG